MAQTGMYLLYMNDGDKIILKFKSSPKIVKKPDEYPDPGEDYVLICSGEDIIMAVKKGKNAPRAYSLLKELQEAGTSDVWWIEGYYEMSDFASQMDEEPDEPAEPADSGRPLRKRK